MCAERQRPIYPLTEDWKIGFDSLAQVVAMGYLKRDEMRRDRSNDDQKGQSCGQNKSVDIQSHYDARLRPRRHRKPKEPRDLCYVARAVARAKTMIRHAVKTIAATHPMTPTSREEAPP